MNVANDEPEVKDETQDFITVLTSADGKVLTKRHTPAGPIDYDRGYLFTSAERAIRSIEDLAAALDRRPDECVILGRVKPDVDNAKPHRRLLHGEAPSYTEAAHGFAIVDIDGAAEDRFAWLDDIAATVQRVVADWLPPELAGADVAWRLTGSAGIKPGIRMRLAFMLDRRLGTGELKAWFADRPNVDHAVFAAVQPIFGNPVFDGVPDPIEVDRWPLERSGILRGKRRRASPPEGLQTRARENGAPLTSWQTGAPESLETVAELLAAIPAPDDYKLVRDIAASIAATNIPDDPDMSERADLFCDWACSGSVADHDGQDFRRVFFSLAKPGGIGPGTLFHYAEAAIYADDTRSPAELFARLVPQLWPELAKNDPELVVGWEVDNATGFDELLEIELPAPRVPIRAGSDKGKAILERVIAELGGVTPGALKLFRGRAEALAMPTPVMLVDRIIPAGKLILPYGSTSEGKTYFGIEIATAVAMRRPAFGEFGVNLPGDSGVVVIFAGEDCTEIDQSRLVAIEQHYGRSLTGLVFTTDLAIPLTNPVLFERYRDELKLIQDMTGKPIDLILNDTLGRSIQGLKANDQDTGQRFTAAMEQLIREFDTTILCSAHDNKSASGTISGTQAFLDNVPVTPHVEGIKAGVQLTGFKVTMEPKFRVGAPPKPFTVRALTVALPKPVNGSHSDIVFTLDRSGALPPSSMVRAKIIAALPIDGAATHIQFVCESSGLSQDTIVRHVRGKAENGKIKVKPDCRDLIVADDDGMPPARADLWYFRLPMGN